MGLSKNSVPQDCNLGVYMGIPPFPDKTYVLIFNPQEKTLRCDGEMIPGMINELAKHDGCKDALVEAGIIPILLNVMQGHAGNPHVQALGLKCLATLCANSTSIQSGLYPGELLSLFFVFFSWVNHGESVIAETSRPGKST